MITRDDILARVSVPFGLSYFSQLSENDDNYSEPIRTYINKNIDIPETEAEYNAIKDKTRRIAPHLYLKDTINSCFATLEGLPYNYTQDFCNELNDLHKKYKKIAFEIGGGQSKGKFVSSSLADSKKKRHHGCFT